MTSIMILSILTEALITYIKTWVMDKKIQWQQIASVVIGIAISIAYGIDIPASVGVTSPVPYIGSVITGILISRGSNYINDIIKKLLAGKQSVQNELPAGSDASDGVMI